VILDLLTVVVFVAMLAWLIWMFMRTERDRW
jgi:hypothetical protein